MKNATKTNNALDEHNMRRSISKTLADLHSTPLQLLSLQVHQVLAPRTINHSRPVSPVRPPNPIQPKLVQIRRRKKNKQSNLSPRPWPTNKLVSSTPPRESTATDYTQIQSRIQPQPFEKEKHHRATAQSQPWPSIVIAQNLQLSSWEHFSFSFRYY